MSFVTGSSPGACCDTHLLFPSQRPEVEDIATLPHSTITTKTPPDVDVSSPAPELPTSSPVHPPPFDVDTQSDSESIALVNSTSVAQSSKRVHPCEGYKLDIPEEKSPHTAYPFGLHEATCLPWDYAVRGRAMLLTSHKCRKKVRKEGAVCQSCASLSLSPVIQGILDRMNHGTHINTTHAYRGFDELTVILKRHADQNQFLRFHALNQARSILRKTEKISDHDRLLVAISSESVARVDRVIHVALRQKRGVVAVLSQVMAAARGAYSVKSFTDQERLLGTLLWRLGGDRVGHVVHRALGLPGVNTLREGSVKMPIVACAGTPTIDRVAWNTVAVLAGIAEVLEELSKTGVIHMVLMFDELACEKRLRYCTHTGEILGLCRQHGPKLPLKFDNVGDVEEIYRALDEGEVHYAGDVSYVILFVLID